MQAAPSIALASTPTPPTPIIPPVLPRGTHLHRLPLSSPHSYLLPVCVTAGGKVAHDKGNAQQDGALLRILPQKRYQQGGELGVRLNGGLLVGRVGAGYNQFSVG